jgi:4-amino-4-deoxy-L-arabinose transferase-like glycosyltransferase
MALAVLDQEMKSSGPTKWPAPSDPVSWKRSTVLYPVLAAFVLRLTFLLILRTYNADRVDDFCIAGETTNIAASVASGHGFSSAFNGYRSGPTAWLAPGYPYFVALVFRFLGLMTRSSIIFIFGVQSLFSALTVIPILGIASHSVGRRAGFWGAWIWALFPWFSKWSVTWLWDTSLSTLLLALLFWWALKLPEAPSRKAWIVFGALWGAALLVNPSLGAFLPVSLAWCSFELHRRHREWLKPSALSLAMCLIVISPWVARNRAVFGQWVFLRSNFGFEFALGNYHSSLGRGWGGPHPSGNMKEFQEYWRMGEIAYIRSRGERAFQFVREYPREFATLTAKRVSYFWDGSSMDYLKPIPWYWMPSSYAVVSFLVLPALLIAHRRRLQAWPMFFGLLLLYPVPYYLTFTQVRYRHPIEPIMVLLIAFAGAEAARNLRLALGR